MARKIILLKGMQASSKSTWAKNFVKENNDYHRIERDAFRHMLTNYTFTEENEKIVDKLHKLALKELLLSTDKNLIIDEMHLNDKYTKQQIDFILDICPTAKIEVKEFPVTLGEALERDKNRHFPIGASVLKNTWRRYEVELKQMLDRHKPKYPWDSSLPYCIVCDIDGTLSHSPNRRIYSDDVDGDTIIFPVWSILDKYKDKVTVILMSGREEKTREATEKWLKTEGVNYQHLYMRKTKDKRSDTIVKRELFDEYVRGKYMPMFVIDDRPCVVEMWVAMGLFVFNVNQDPMCLNNF